MGMMDNVGGMSPSGGGGRAYLPTLLQGWIFNRGGGGGRGGRGGGGTAVTPRRELENQTLFRANTEQIGINAQGMSFAQQIAARDLAQKDALKSAGVRGSRSKTPTAPGAGVAGTTGPLENIQFGTLLGGTPASGQTALQLGSQKYGAPTKPTRARTTKPAEGEAAPAKRPRTKKTPEPAPAASSGLWLPTSAGPSGETTAYAPGGKTSIDLTSAPQAALDNWRSKPRS